MSSYLLLWLRHKFQISLRSKKDKRYKKIPSGNKNYIISAVKHVGSKFAGSIIRGLHRERSVLHKKATCSVFGEIIIIYKTSGNLRVEPYCLRIPCFLRAI
jgi:hypothetical protein